ncbi:uncharacterized protein LOC124134844 [Haliotis rufescens]|uniref:uncharacterized protein LOC124134844 n=1 Tax=Haliotis rufescens TaxID=6454 RepID=UPI001EB05E50|nr:uncharacterized protein LOC124134844 [Haliotis rufescens]
MNVNPSHRRSGIPVTKNMPHVSASMPGRHQPRNMTGIYLGLEGNIKPPGSHGPVPPLARGRGLSSRIRTTAEDRRYKMVEVLRLKEEKRGFSGQPLRRKVNMSERPTYQSREQVSSARRWGPAKRLNPSNVEDLIKTNSRSYTHIANSGVTRSENLTGWPGEGDHVFMLPDHVIRSAVPRENVMGLEECYRKVCKGSIETLHTLLPSSSTNLSSQHRRHRDPSASYAATGFSVRSYRNPNQAEIITDFPLPRTSGRPQTVPIRRPHVPQPYFFQFYNQTKLISPNGPLFNKGAPGTTEDPDNAVRIFAAPGAGILSHTLHLQSALSEPDHHQTHKEQESLPPSFCRTFHGATADSQQLEISMPISADIPVSEDDQTNRTSTLAATEELDPHHTSQRAAQDRTMDDGYQRGGGCDSAETKEYQDELLVGRTLKSSSSGADITVGLEKEDGTTDQVEIDDVEEGEAAAEPPESESPKGNVRKASIADKLVKTKQSEAMIATLKENAEQRQKDFQKLLNEHAEIVQEIGRTASSENLISQAEHGERDH